MNIDCDFHSGPGAKPGATALVEGIVAITCSSSRRLKGTPGTGNSGGTIDGPDQLSWMNFT